MQKLISLLSKYALYLAFLQAWAASLGSLYFSEIAKFPPCILCWYQRICLYPLVAILTVGILRGDKKVCLYVLPLSITGFIIAIYHNLLYYKLIPESIKPCEQGISCTTKYIEWFGFVTIPLLSLTTFLIISILMIIMILFKSKK
ncbi:MAG: putative disulfide formation protein [Parcubacteria group bacterium GW2011_GWA1_36_12]|nr:MAG: putative disulfide formation protein [Parcubacteria group bacterium GW2011_GWA1_36_12]